MTGEGPPAAKRSASSVKWADLGRRFGSAIVLLILATLLMLSSGLWLRFGISVVAGLLMWELARLTGWRHPEYHSPRHPGLIGLLGGLTALAMLTLPGDWPLALLLVPALAGLPGTNRHERGAYVVFTIAMLVAAYAFVVIHEVMGLPTILWIVGTVILSDVLGYFVGRRLGGPRFWPALSPKKTGSGTIAGWVGAILLALVLWGMGLGGWGVLIAGPLLAIAGQFGDIAESWLKRRVDVKDSSTLIPGHGGVMDRFDAMSGALLAAFIMMIAGVLPVIGG